MKSRLVLASACVVAFLLGVWHDQPLAGQALPGNVSQPHKTTPPAKVGKYQIALGGVNNALMYLCDTETGHVWGKTPAGWNLVASAPPPAGTTTIAPKK